MVFENSSFSVKLYDFLFSPDGRAPENTVVVEAFVATFSLCARCGVPVAPFDEGDAAEDELIRLARFLEGLAECGNIAEEIGGRVNAAAGTELAYV